MFVSLSNYFGILIPQKIRQALDFVQVQVEQNKSGFETATGIPDELSYTLFIFGVTVIGFMILKGIFMFLMRQTIIVTSRLIEYDMRKEIFAKLETLDASFYKGSRTGDIMARISEDVSKVRNYLGPGILYGINLFSLFSITIIAMISVNPELALYTLIPLPFLSLSIYYVSNLINKKSTVIQGQVSKLTSIAQEVFSGIRVVKSYGKEAQFNQYFKEESETFKTLSLDLAKVNSYFFPLMILLVNLSTLIVLYLGGIKVGNEQLSAGTIAEFIIYVNMLTWPVTSIGWIVSIIQEAEASQQRINELLVTNSEIISGGERLKQIKGLIEFENVNFIYNDSEIHALKNINLKINAGDRIAVVGRTASGKSTFAELLLRIYDVNSGVIKIDGKPIESLNKEDLRVRIGYVPQDVFLFSDTVSNNISFGHENSNQQEIEMFAGYASVKEDILKLPEGFNTIVGERGVTLSGGQKQRVSIARALIKQPDVIILDDCLSAVDTETEHRIIQYLNTAMKDKTSIVITHRISGLFDFDKIIVLDNGEIAEMGSHEELLKQNGIYSELYQNSMMSEEAYH